MNIKTRITGLEFRHLEPGTVFVRIGDDLSEPFIRIPTICDAENPELEFNAIMLRIGELTHIPNAQPVMKVNSQIQITRPSC